MAITYYISSTDAATGLHTATHEQLLTITNPGTGSPETVTSNSIAGGGSELVLVATTASGQPNSAAWPTGSYTCEVDCTAVGGSITYGLLTVGSAVGHFARVASDLSSELQVKNQNAAAFSGTGIKSATTGSTSWSAGNAGDRFEIAIAAGRPASHGNETISIQINETDDAATGPWASVTSGVGTSSVVVSATGTGASTAESDGTSAVAITGAGVGTGIISAVGSSSVAVTVAAVGDAVSSGTPDPIARYWVNEAASGQSPTTIADSEASPVNLSITYVSDTPAYTSIAAGRGLDFPTGNVDTAGAFSGTLSGGNKIFDALDGATQATMEVVVEITTAMLNGDIADPINIFGVYDFDGSDDPLGMFWWGNKLVVDYDGPSGYTAEEYNEATSGLSAGVHVFHYVLDTPNATQASRQRLYMDGNLLTPSAASTPTQDSTIDIPTATSHIVSLGGWQDYVDVGGGFAAAIYYAALYDVALTDTQIDSQATALAASNDPPGSVGTSSVAVTVSGVGASTSEADGTSAVVVTAAGTGSSTAESDGASAVAITVAGGGASTAETDGTSAVAVTGTGVGASTAAAAGTCNVTVTGSGVGASTAEADGTSSIVVTVAGEGAALGGGVQSGAGTANVVVSAAGVGSSTAEADGSSAVAVTVAGVGTGIVATAGLSACTVAVAAVGSSTAEADGLSACVVSVAGTGSSTAESDGASAVVVTVAGAGSTAEGGIESGAGTCAIACTVLGTASSTAEADGACSIAVSVAGAGARVLGASGLSACVVAAAGVGSSIAAAVGSCAVTLSSAGAAASTAEAVGSSVVVVTTTGVSGSVIPPDPPIVTGWTKAAVPSVTAWAKASGGPIVTSWTKNEDEALPMAA